MMHYQNHEAFSTLKEHAIDLHSSMPDTTEAICVREALDNLDKITEVSEKTETLLGTMQLSKFDELEDIDLGRNSVGDKVKEKPKEFISLLKYQQGIANKMSTEMLPNFRSTLSEQTMQEKANSLTTGANRGLTQGVGDSCTTLLTYSSAYLEAQTSVITTNEELTSAKTNSPG